MTTDKTLKYLAASRRELEQALADVRRVRALINRGLNKSSMSPTERIAWEIEVSAVLKGTGIKLARTYE